MTEQQANALLTKYQDGTCSPEEAALVTAWLDGLGTRAAGVLPPEEELRFQQLVTTTIQQQTGIDVRLPAEPVYRVHFLRTTWFRWAAILLLLAGTSTLFYKMYNRPPQVVTNNQRVQQPDIQPGGNKAMLTLSDGNTIALDSAAAGELAQQGNTTIIKLHSGALAYNAGAAGGAIGYNTIHTPKGGQYQITLPDGTKVWLNAASSIRFPTVFIQDRKVAVTGEVYMEVAADKNKPFIVEAGNNRIDVLGTSFNITAYPDDADVRSTLVSGSIKVNQQIVLTPGQQAIYTSSGRVTQVVRANIGQVLAWKSGLFDFSGKDFSSLMKDVERWYDVQVTYSGAVPSFKMKGGMDRGVPLSDLIRFLQEYGLHIKLEGRQLQIGEQ